MMRKRSLPWMFLLAAVLLACARRRLPPPPVPTTRPSATPLPTSTVVPPPSATPLPSPTPELSSTPAADFPIPLTPSSPNKYEFVATGNGECGGIAPLPGCVYELESWIGKSGPIDPGGSIKILLMHPRSEGGPDTESCKGYTIQDGAYSSALEPVRIRARGEPCDWNPNYMFCVCDAEDFILLESRE